MSYGCEGDFTLARWRTFNTVFAVLTPFPVGNPVSQVIAPKKAKEKRTLEQSDHNNYCEARRRS
jgi:hypothetical protein